MRAYSSHADHGRDRRQRNAQPPATGSPIQRLQKAVGNRQTMRYLQRKLGKGVEKNKPVFWSQMPDAHLYVVEADHSNRAERLFGKSKGFYVVGHETDRDFKDRKVSIDDAEWFRTKQEAIDAKAARSVPPDETTTESKESKSDVKKGEDLGAKFLPGRGLKAQGKELYEIGKAMKQAAEKPMKAVKGDADSKAGSALNTVNDAVKWIDRAATAFPPLKVVTKPLHWILKVPATARNTKNLLAAMKSGEANPLLGFQEARNLLLEIPQPKSDAELKAVQEIEEALTRLEQFAADLSKEAFADWEDDPGVAE